jgi:hypothetical protein
MKGRQLTIELMNLYIYIYIYVYHSYRFWQPAPDDTQSRLRNLHSLADLQERSSVHLGCNSKIRSLLNNLQELFIATFPSTCLLATACVIASSEC